LWSKLCGPLASNTSWAQAPKVMVMDDPIFVPEAGSQDFSFGSFQAVPAKAQNTNKNPYP
jgi:hypothetical protein